MSDNYPTCTDGSRQHHWKLLEKRTRGPEPGSFYRCPKCGWMRNNRGGRRAFSRPPASAEQVQTDA